MQNQPAVLKRSFTALKRGNFSKPQLAIFILAFALIGYLLIRAFAAAPLIASLESEAMTPNIPTTVDTTGFSTTLQQNSTVNAPYIWAFNPGTATTAGYFYSDGKLLSKVSGAGPYAFRLNSGVLTAGTHQLGHAWDTPDGLHQTPASAYSVSINNTSGKGFITTVIQNSTINTPYLWAFDTGTATTAGYFWADGKLLNKVSGAGPYVWTLSGSTLSAGSHKLGHAWDTSTGTHQSPSNSYNVTVNNPAASTLSASTISDSTASGGKAEKFSAGVTLNGSLSLPSAGASMTVMAHGEQCSSGGWPTMSVLVDGAQVVNTTVSTSSWTSYTLTKSLTAGTHSLAITNASPSTCAPNLYADVTNIYGPITPPTVSLTANPTSITSGSSSTISWSSTDATSCSAVNGWSTSTATSGTQSVSPTASTTYSMTCTGSGGSVSASTTVTVTAGFTTSLTNGMTITPPYNWTFNPGVSSVKGYFYADGNLLYTTTPDASGSYAYTLPTTALTAGAHTLGHAWDLADGSHHTPPSAYSVTISSTTTTPQPAPTGTTKFDGRAKLMTALSSTGLSTTNNIVQYQSPQTWDCLCFTNNSMSLVSDSHYSKVYKNYEGPGDRSPWNTGLPANDADGRVTKIMPNDLGLTDYYAFAVKVPAGWSNPDWSTIMDLGYETVAWDQVGLNINPVNGAPMFQYYQNAGYVNCPTTTCAGTSFEKVDIQPVTYDQWTEFIYAIKWSTNQTGFAKVYTRVPGGTWALKVDIENIDTYIYGTTSYRSVKQDMSDEPTILDKMGLYYGYWNTATTSFPYETVYNSGFTVNSDFNTAASTLP